MVISLILSWLTRFIGRDQSEPNPASLSTACLHVCSRAKKKLYKGQPLYVPGQQSNLLVRPSPLSRRQNTQPSSIWPGQETRGKLLTPRVLRCTLTYRWRGAREAVFFFLAHNDKFNVFSKIILQALCKHIYAKICVRNSCVLRQPPRTYTQTNKQQQRQQSANETQLQML